VKGEGVIGGQRVLLIDGLDETEQVLKAVLEPQGTRIDRVCRDQMRQNAAVGAPPDVVIVHENAATSDTESFRNVPRILIGTAKLPDNCAASTVEHCLPRLFQYRDLIQAVEGLLAAPSQDAL
jgi:hypothetical protein